MIDEITANITTINEVPLRSKESSEISYRTKVENFLKAVKIQLFMATNTIFLLKQKMLMLITC